MRFWIFKTTSAKKSWIAARELTTNLLTVKEIVTPQACRGFGSVSSRPLHVAEEKTFALNIIRKIKFTMEKILQKKSLT